MTYLYTEARISSCGAHAAPMARTHVALTRCGARDTILPMRDRRLNASYGYAYYYVTRAPGGGSRRARAVM